MPPEMTGMAVNGGANMAGDGRGDIAGARYTNESRGERLSVTERRGLAGAKLNPTRGGPIGSDRVDP
jgi:hypothetical protein